jgi:hypothetical protein
VVGHRLRSADGVEVSTDQHFDARFGSCDGAENLAATRFRFDIADPHIQVTLRFGFVGHRVSRHGGPFDGGYGYDPR